MKAKILTLFVGLSLLLTISACSTIKSFFPDKEKDYQLSSEIPALKIPADLSDLSGNTAQDSAVIEQAIIKENSPVSQRIKTVTPESHDKERPVSIVWVKLADSTLRIRIEDSIKTTWRRVGKALSRHSIEITDRNKKERIFLVQYDPDFKKVEDGSLWDEFWFIFGGDPAQEKEFGIRLVEKKTNTEIFVVDENDTPLSDGTGLKLLNLLHKTLEEDLQD